MTMRRLLLVCAALLAIAGVSVTWTPAPAAALPAPAAALPDKCAACHLETGDDRLMKPVKDFPGDVHAAKGFGCVACHGGDAKADGMEAMDPAKGFIGKPDRKQVAQVCGRCHGDARFMKRYNPALRTDQASAYATSVHGTRLRESNDAKVATCASCHPAHSIKPPSDPASSVHALRVAETCGRCHGNAKYMAEYTIPTDQVAKYKKSVHANAMIAKGDLSAPTCNDCHGNHGAAPPGVSWVGNVCGQCHTVMGELFAKSVHAKAFQQLGVPGCATCHDNHEIKPTSDAMLGVGATAVCASCHDKNDKAGRAAEEMRASIEALRAKYEQAREVLGRAEKAGMEVSQAQFDLNSAKDALVKARAAVHGFTVESVKKETDPGVAVATKAEARGIRALEDLVFRRRGLAVSAVVSLALIAALVLKIRQIDRRGSGTPPEEGDGADGRA